jgi:protein-L-isoaspartate(D-aspartate) O-methyltransferase
MAADFAAARMNMVESQIRTADVTDLPLQDAIRLVDRQDLLPATKAHAAYADVEVEYAPGLFLMRPRDVAKLMHALKPRGGEKALAIAAPYAAAVFEAMGLAVDRLEGDDLTTVTGSNYDVVITEGAVTTVPQSWRAALALHGRMGVVERTGPVGRAMVYIRSEDGIGGRSVFDAAARMLPGFAPKPAFAF